MAQSTQIVAGPSSKSPVDDVTIKSEDARRKVFQDRIKFKPERVKHDKTAVLMLHWNAKNDDLGVGPEVGLLEKVLKDTYGFDVSVQQLEANDKPERAANLSPEFQAKRFLTNFLGEHDSHQSLLIVYYAGHGHSKAADDSNIVLTGRRTDLSPHDNKSDADDWKERKAIDWVKVEQSLSDATSDVLVIFDCCQAGLLCRPAKRGAQSFHYLAACSATESTRRAGPHSFTTAITHALQKLAMQTDFSGFYVDELLEMILEAPNFPRDQQCPRYYKNRFSRRRESLFIAPMPDYDSSPGEQKGQFRDEQEQILQKQDTWDVSFGFETDMSNDEITSFADRLNRLLDGDEPRCRTITLLPKSDVLEFTAVGSEAVKGAVLHWRSVTHKRKSLKHTTTQTSNEDPGTPTSSSSTGTPRKASKGKNKILSPSAQTMLSPSASKSVQLPRLSIPGLETSVTDFSEAETVNPASSHDERSPLLGCPGNGHDAGVHHKVAADESSVMYHLQTAAHISVGRVTQALKWSASQFSCWPRDRHIAKGPT